MAAPITLGAWRENLVTPNSFTKILATKVKRTMYFIVELQNLVYAAVEKPNKSQSFIMFDGLSFLLG